ncbi:MAG TPA: NAD(P)-dependent oxidoreductase [Plantibacter sp.]|nr:NAD(P)-dependent oxidoreductase [Plantibacter sp.]
MLGSRGFVGSTLLAHLSQLDWPAEGISSQALDLTADGAAESLAAQLRANDSLVFVSGLTPDRGKDAATFERNIRMVRAVAEALALQPVAHVVNIGTDAVYSDDANPVRESSCASPSSLHGAMHLAREVILTDVCRSAGIALVLLRPSLLYGPGDTHNGYGPNRFARNGPAEGKIGLFGEGEEQRDHVFIEDVARLISAVLERGSTGVVNVATGTAASFREAAELVAELSPAEIAVEGTPRANPVTHRHFDIAATREAFPGFGWTPLRDGLERTLAADAGSAARA